jgi:predicted RNA-binding Zn-ribbon protein involved in translation (DUF1610 family)
MEKDEVDMSWKGDLIKKAKEAQWICVDCGNELIGQMPDGHLATFHYDICGVCGKRKICTEPRDFNWRPIFK